MPNAVAPIRMSDIKQLHIRMLPYCHDGGGIRVERHNLEFQHATNRRSFIERRRIRN